MTKMSKEEFFHYLKFQCGYLHPVLLPDGHYKCIYPLLYTFAIVVGRIGDVYSYDDRWCYHNYESAKNAFDDWNGIGEPIGWHRHPSSGRRVNEEGENTADG